MSRFLDLIMRLFRYAPVPSKLEGLNRLEATYCKALAEMMYPKDAGPWPSYEEAKVLEELAYYLRGVVPQKRIMIGLLLTFGELASLLYPPFRRFSKRTPVKRLALLESWNDSRIPFLNLCAASLRSLLNLAYLSDIKVLEQIGEAPPKGMPRICSASTVATGQGWNLRRNHGISRPAGSNDS